MALQNSTIILRFRDLATVPGDTVRMHNEIAQTGYVWWGWWHKSGETVPESTFRALLPSAKAGELRVLLFDSGHGELFEVQCEDLHWDHTLIPQLSPEPERTPSYYRTRPCKAWFKFGAISQGVSSGLQEWTYERVDEMFESKPSKYTAFYDKIVFDTEELRQQDRTMWVVRRRQMADGTHRVSLLDSRRISPRDFPTKSDVESSRSLNLLWLSDLHFSMDGHHAFPITPSPSQSNLSNAIDNALRTHKIDSIGGILISGDLTWRAAPDEFALVRDFIRQMASSPSALDNYRILLCPGNHDIAFSPAPEDKKRKIADNVVPESAKAAYSALYNELFYKQPNKYLSNGRRLLLVGAIPVEIVGLNSSYLDQRDGWFQGQGFVGQEQLDAAAREMGWDVSSVPRAIRIVMLHHHVIPVAYRMLPEGGYYYSTALDAGALMDWICKHKVDLVLHGHMHEDFHGAVTRRAHGENTDHTFHIAGLGSTGVAVGDRGEKPNMFSVLQFGERSLKVNFYTVHPSGPSELHDSFEISTRH